MKLEQKHLRRGRRSGFTLLEALLLVTILGIGGAAIGTSLRAMVRSPEQNNTDFATESALVDKMEFLHSLPFATLATDVGRYPSNYSDTPTVEGAATARTTNIIYVVPTTGVISGSATHMLQLSVTIGSKTVVSVVNEP